ncbi:hypothetical protein QE152_g36856 [Popillia japonica]|uniref:Uncharacterized protein n=1 Tax=Popillia japonica TaxID=7064 RepID=A0AAW1ICG9_POPJA
MSALGSKKGKSLVSGRDVSKKTKKDKNENLIPPCRPIEEETICPLYLDSHEEDWIQCGKCKAWVYEACANISKLSHQYFCESARRGSTKLVRIYQSYHISIFAIIVYYKWSYICWLVLEANSLETDLS